MMMMLLLMMFMTQFEEKKVSVDANDVAADAYNDNGYQMMLLV